MCATENRSRHTLHPGWSAETRHVNPISCWRLLHQNRTNHGFGNEKIGSLFQAGSEPRVWYYGRGWQLRFLVAQTEQLCIASTWRQTESLRGTVRRYRRRRRQSRECWREAQRGLSQPKVSQRFARLYITRSIHQPIVNGSEPRQAASSLSPEPLLSDPCLLGVRERPAGEVDHLVSILRI